MKYDISKKPTIGAKRTLNALFRAMIILLSEKSFEDITVQEICSVSMLPRATFYNYFDDKYDLLSYCWIAIGQLTYPQIAQLGEHEDILLRFLDNVTEFLEVNIETTDKILRHNGPNQYLLNDCRAFLSIRMQELFRSCPLSENYKIPYEMIARLHCNAVLLILEWKFLEKKELTRDQAHEYLKLMVNRDNLIRA